MNISKPYTNFVSIPITQNSQGRYFTDTLWAKDILLHIDYIDHFNLCCPVETNDNVAGLEDITDYKINTIFPLKKDGGFISVFKNIVPNFLGVLKACKQSEIVHSGGAGWAFPLSFYILPLKFFLKFEWIIVIESSFWLLNKNDRFSLRKVFSHIMHKYLLKACVKMADARIFTQSFYRKLFLGSSTTNSMINPATWINKSNLIDPSELHTRNHSNKDKPISLLFPARLIEDKGVRTLFSAIQLLANKQISTNISIIGEGELKDEAIAFAKQSFGNVNVTFLDPVEYGPDFFNLIQEYDAVLVPNLKDEQPRIIFDAFSQGVGVIASNTSGILEIVEADKNAFLFNAGDSQHFAEVLIKAINNPNATRNLGVNGLQYVHGKTHRNMHQDRLVFLNATLN